MSHSHEQVTDVSVHATSKSRLTRRNVLVTSAWAVPTITVASAVPAFAVSDPVGSGHETPLVFGYWPSNTSGGSGNTGRSVLNGSGVNTYYRLRWGFDNSTVPSPIARSLTMTVTIDHAVGKVYTLPTATTGSGSSIQAAPQPAGTGYASGQTQDAPTFNWSGLTVVSPTQYKITSTTDTLSVAYMAVKLDLLSPMDTLAAHPTVTVTATADSTVLASTTLLWSTT